MFATNKKRTLDVRETHSTLASARRCAVAVTMASVHELQRLRKVARQNVNNWQVECHKADAPRLAGDDEPLLRASTGFKIANELLRGLDTLYGHATGWAEVNGFGIFATKPPVQETSEATCLHPGCVRKQHARGLCNTHYHTSARKKRVRKPCVDGRTNHSYNTNDVCIHCRRGRA